MNGPDPLASHPMAGAKRVCYLKNVIKDPRIIVGDYSYYDDPSELQAFETENVLYHFGDDRLIIGKYCAIAHGAKFIMNGANHQLSGFSTYPFFTFKNGWERVTPAPGVLPTRGDTTVGNDVWIGYDALILPGVQIGDGAIIGARAVVTKNVASYTVVAGNPAIRVGERFNLEVAAELIAIAWWDWPAEKVTRNLEAIVGSDLDHLRSAR